MPTREDLPEKIMLINYFKKTIFLLSLLLGIIAITSCTTQVAQPDIVKTVNLYRLSAENRLVPYFEMAGVAYPPQKIALLAFKQEKKLELWAKADGKWHYIKTYPILAASGHAGPKLWAGDDQVPEGIYKIKALNPHSRFHLSLYLNYPNTFDLQYARHDGRRYPGGEIFIHGWNRSEGCLAMGSAIEELFVLVYEVGLTNTEVIIAPNDMRYQPPIRAKGREPVWLPILYNNIAQALQPFTEPSLQG